MPTKYKPNENIVDKNGNLVDEFKYKYVFHEKDHGKIRTLAVKRGSINEELFETIYAAFEYCRQDVIKCPMMFFFALRGILKEYEKDNEEVE